ncbi:hypothetical protein [Deinococcus ruber]|uniref:Uncharacterized protein n=1 Tax=Deinococcus ruber TaxID=1848197 RepID=A0A918CLB2_9DEIO|nr:hypothetical protein [Deinococcus ruber]GGR27100.1 hypothetical protein GCM10008957_43060 [Deinococcus ruber]
MQMMVGCIRLDRDCADAFTARLLMRGSDLHQQACRMCDVRQSLPHLRRRVPQAGGLRSGRLSQGQREREQKRVLHARSIGTPYQNPVNAPDSVMRRMG